VLRTLSFAKAQINSNSKYSNTNTVEAFYEIENKL